MSHKFSIEDVFQDVFFLEYLLQKPKTPVKTIDDRIIEEFEEINDFFEQNQRKPELTDIFERKLYKRLE